MTEPSPSFRRASPEQKEIQMNTTTSNEQVRTNKSPQGLRRAIRSGAVLIGAAALLASALTAVLHAAGSQSDVTPGVLPPQSHAYGKTYGEWAAEWEKLLFSIPLDRSPLLVHPCASVTVGQSGPVLLLVGSCYPAPGETCNPDCANSILSKSVTVPSGKALFFSLGWGAAGTCPEDPNFQPAPGQTLEDFLSEVVGSGIDSVVTELTAEVDGVPVKNVFQYRANSGLITFDFDPSFEGFVAPCGTGAGEHQDLIDGYWLLLTPPSKGQHTVRWIITLGPPFDLSVEDAFYITVE